MTVVEKIAAQKRYCDKYGMPHFAPSDGVCWRCHRQIYEELTDAEASSTLVTGCPRCGCSYCD